MRMRGFFSTENLPYRLMNKIYQLVVLNLVFIWTCLPIITIGAALTALYGTAFKMTEEAEERLVAGYLRRLKNEWKQGTKIWLFFLAIFLTIGICYPIFKNFLAHNLMAFLFFMLFCAVSLLTSIYVFPLLAKFENSSREILIQAFFLAMKNMSYSIFLFFLFLFLIVGVPIFFSKLFFLWLLIACSLNAYLGSFIFLSIFAKYTENQEINKS